MRSGPRSTCRRGLPQDLAEMRTILILVFVVAAGTGGEVVLTHAMKQLGEVHDFRPRAIANFV